MEQRIAEDGSPPNARAGWSPQDRWHIPIRDSRWTLADAVMSMGAFDKKARSTPVHRRRSHDYVHVLLGRGLLPKDKAFVTGFIMGSSQQMGYVDAPYRTQEAERLYRGNVWFGLEEHTVFEDAVRLGFTAHCAGLTGVDWAYYADRALKDVRAVLGINDGELLAYYSIEGPRYPDAQESLRLLDTQACIPH